MRRWRKGGGGIGGGGGSVVKAVHTSVTKIQQEEVISEDWVKLPVIPTYYRKRGDSHDSGSSFAETGHLFAPIVVNDWLQELMSVLYAELFLSPNAPVRRTGK